MTTLGVWCNPVGASLSKIHGNPTGVLSQCIVPGRLQAHYVAVNSTYNTAAVDPYAFVYRA